MLKILYGGLQQDVNRELPDVQAGFRRGRGTRDQIANICWIIEKAREFQKKKKNKKQNIACATLSMLKLLTVWITTNCEKFSKDGNTRLAYLPPEKPVSRSRSNS